MALTIIIGAVSIETNVQGGPIGTIVTIGQGQPVESRLDVVRWVGSVQ